MLQVAHSEEAAAENSATGIVIMVLLLLHFVYSFAKS